jgi:hypothetical protein
MPFLRRLIIVFAGALAAAALVTASAQARVVEIGTATGTPGPTCPSSPCLAISRTTGYGLSSATSHRRSPYRVPANGWLVAWTVALGAPTAQQVSFFNDAFGSSKAGITVLRKGHKKLQRFNVGFSPLVKLQPYFGQTVQFPLHQAIRVRKGQLVALTVPTWAPALSQLLSDGTSWLASRPRGGCDNTDTQTAHLQLGPTRYRCKYAARLTYSATEITSPIPTATTGH